LILVVITQIAFGFFNLSLLLSSFFNAIDFIFYCSQIQLLLPLTSANGLQTVQRLLALALFYLPTI
jgi:hypothetical protein